MSTSDTARPSPDLTAPTTVAGAARVAGWGLAFWGGTQLAAGLLERRATALALVQAALAEWGAGRMGITWSDPLAPIPSLAAVGRRAARGAAMGAAAAVAAMAVALATGGAVIALIGPSLGSLVVGLFASILAAVRDELLLRGVVLRATRGLFPTEVSLLACGAAAAAARWGADGAFTMAVATDGLRAIALGALWVRDRGAWMACAANAAWMWTLGAVVHGGLVDARFAADPDCTGSVAALLAALAVVALATIGRRSLWSGLR